MRYGEKRHSNVILRDFSQIKVVTPQYGLITASRCQNADAFFALVGGGPGNVGVIIESTHIVQPQTAFRELFVFTFLYLADILLEMLQVTLNTPSEEVANTLVCYAISLINVSQ